MGVAQVQTQEPLENENDADLLVYMSMRQDDPDLARKAWEVFYNRHIRWMYVACRRALGNTTDHEAIIDLVHDLTRKVFEKSASFDSRGETDPNRLRKKVLAWVGKVGKNLFIDTVRRHPKLVALEDSDECVDPKTVAGPKPVKSVDPTMEIRSAPTPLKLLMLQALENLPERDRQVLLVSMQYHDLANPQVKLPKEVMEALANQFGTTEVNIRKIRSRAMQQIRKFVEDNLKQKKTV